MNIHKKDSRIIAVLLVALVLQILALLWHMNLLPWTKDHADSSAQQWAGKIISVQKDLQRRGQNSLIWEGSREDEKLYFYDSLLTLKESEAIIELQNETRITIGENTLISIEPPQKDKSQEIIVQFSKGRFSARNPYNRTQVKEERLSFTLDAGSEVEISKDNDNYTEIDVKKGGIQLEVGGKKTTIEENKWVAIDRGVITQKELDTELAWFQAPAKRHYIRGNSLDLNFEWMGEATDLQIKAKNGEEKIHSLSAQQKKMNLNFQVGEYQIRLMGDNKMGPNFVLQVWQAPSLHLLKPEPRNRISFEEQRFIWTPLHGTASYELRLIGAHTNELVNSQDNEARVEFDKEDDVLWEVWGVDSDGFKIPPAYKYPLYIRESPFAPPKLYQPQAVPPKSSQNSWQNIWMNFLIPKAFAQKSMAMGALLTWQSIPGADLYIVEISDSKDFRRLIHSQEVNTNKYIFRNLSASEKLYWRVAAGSSSGRMGVFSDPDLLTLVELSTIIENQDSKPEPKPEPKRKKQAVTKKVPVKKSAPPPPARAIKPKEVQPEVPFALSRTWIWASSGYGLATLTMDTGSKVNLSGVKPLALGLQMDFQWSFNRNLRLLTHLSQNTYTPKPAPLYPFQSDIENFELSVRALTYKTDSLWIYGLQSSLLPSPQQIDFERVDLTTQLALGPVFGINLETDNFEYLGLLSALVAKESVTVNSLHRFIYKANSWWFVGAELEAYFSLSQKKSLQTYDGRILTGFEF